MVYSYPVTIHKDDDGIWAEFPDLPGCQTFGDSVEEVLENAKEALYCYISEELDYSSKLLPPNTKTITVTDNTITKTITVVIEKNNTVMINEPVTMAG